ncbi:hydrolase [Methylomonas sp. SURF-2]|uniref:Hydrolase n=1 Tax=Methylomonas subterranea TaxID=2952225 RepID=A0ABT1TF08_9GAMM|nr:hydrolase [Methylomonas sp. SURF-2]MCQ8104030.1 hydrolase [Methylomonas sp. SURF-2]
MPITRHVFRPAWWLRSPHLQTLYPALLRKIKPLPRTRERLITPDDDFIDLDWYGENAGVIVILLHGLSGSSESGYILGLQKALLQAGMASVAMNFRGCSGESNRAARCYHSGETEDIDFVYRCVRQRYPDSVIAAVGFSLGGNVLLKWLGEQADKATIAAAVAVCVPLLLHECASKLDKGFSRIYRKYLLDELKRYMDIKRRSLRQNGFQTEADKLNRLGEWSGIKSFWQYDDRVVAKLHGFIDVHDYYRRSSSRQFLSAIRVPTLVIQAADDPFMTPAVLPEAAELSRQVELEIYSGGGHVGFVGAGKLLKAEYWLESRIPQYLLARLDKQELRTGAAD